jgi:hypothetical protein
MFFCVRSVSQLIIEISASTNSHSSGICETRASELLIVDVGFGDDG